MFVTNRLTPAEVLAEILIWRRASASDTAEFSKLRHDKDLLPRIHDRVLSILEVYKAYHSEAHDIQGLRDDGVDILMTYDGDDGQYKVGIQVKSNDEFEQWAQKKLNMVEKLKAQYTARENARIDDYYIVLCADDLKHRKRIRTICSEFKNMKGCTIIEPQEAYAFLQMSPFDVSVRTSRMLCSADPILMLAEREANQDEPDVAYCLVSVVCHAFEKGIDIGLMGLEKIWWEWTEIANLEDDGGERFGEVLLALTHGGSILYERDTYLIDLRDLPPAICAIYFDVRARELEPRAAIRDYLVGLLEIRERTEELEEYEEDND